MCSIEAHARIHPTVNDDVISGSDRLLPAKSTIYALV